MMNQEQALQLAVLLEGLKIRQAEVWRNTHLRELDRILRAHFSGEWRGIGRAAFAKRLRLLRGEVLQALLAHLDAVLDTVATAGAALALARGVQRVDDVLKEAAAMVLMLHGEGQGLTVREMLQAGAQRETRRISGAVSAAWHRQFSSADILRTLRGTRANGFKDGTLGQVSRAMETEIRTAVGAGMVNVQVQTMKALGVTHLRWVSTLDGRTSAICRSYDNQIFPVDAGVYPPAHYNCRSMVVDAQAPVGSRASMTGQVDAGLSYYAWLKQQAPVFQDKVLGKARGEIFRREDMTAERFSALNLDRTFAPQPLEAVTANIADIFRQSRFAQPPLDKLRRKFS